MKRMLFSLIAFVVALIFGLMVQLTIEKAQKAIANSPPPGKVEVKYNGCEARLENFPPPEVGIISVNNGSWKQEARKILLPTSLKVETKVIQRE